MQSLKDYQSSTLAYGLPQRVPVVESFRSYYNFSVNGLIYLNKGYFSLTAGHTSTAGRLYYGDYSGYYDSDQLVRMNYVSGGGALRVGRPSSWNVLIGARWSFYFNTLEMNHSENVLGITNQYAQTFRSTNWGLEGFIEVQKRVKRTLLRCTAGGEIQVPGELGLKDKSGNSVYIGGGGYRINLGAAYTIKLW
jgi:hypothetical protein